MPLENGSATTWLAGSIDRPRRRRPGGCEQLLERRRARGAADREDLLDAGRARCLERALGQRRHGHEEAGAGDAQLERGLLGRVQGIDGRVRPAGAGDAVERDGVLRHVGRVDADDLARREPARSQPGRAAIDVLGQLRVGQHRAADGIDDRRPLATRGRLGEHEIGERDVRHVHVRVRAADRHRPADSTASRRTMGQTSARRSVPDPICMADCAGGAMIRPMTATRPTRPRSPWASDEHELFRETARAWVEREILPNDERWQARGYVDAELWRSAGEAGLLGTDVPAEHGGLGGDFGFECVDLRGAPARGLRVLRQGRARDRDALRARLRHGRAAAGLGAARSCAASSSARSR